MSFRVDKFVIASLGILRYIQTLKDAEVAELVDALDSKSSKA